MNRYESEARIINNSANSNLIINKLVLKVKWKENSYDSKSK